MKAMVSKVADKYQSSKSSSKNINRRAHVGKSKAERAYYTKAIKNTQIDPTLDESLDFIESDDLDSDFSVPTDKGTRRIPLKYKLKSYLENNWYMWVPTVAVAVFIPWAASYLLDNGKQLVKHETKIDYIEKNVEQNTNDLKEISAELRAQAIVNNAEEKASTNKKKNK